MTDTSNLFKGGSPLSPSANEIHITLNTAGIGTLSTTQLGTVASVQSAAYPYTRINLPSFAGETVGSKRMQQTIMNASMGYRCAVFNAGAEGADATLEAVLEPGAILKFKATAASPSGSIVKSGQGKDTLWPLFGDTLTKDLGIATFGTMTPFTNSNGAAPACMLTATLGLFAFTDSNNDVFAFPFSLTADGRPRGVASAITTIRSNANVLVFPTVIRISDTIAVIMWGDNTATNKLEFVACNVVDGTTPSMTVGAVADDTAIASADRIVNTSALWSITPDYNSASNFAFWVTGGMVSAAGQKAYRMSVNSGTLAITLNHSIVYSSNIINTCNFTGVSPAADKLLVPSHTSNGSLVYLSYSGTITTSWTSASIRGLALPNATNGIALRKINDSYGLFSLIGFSEATSAQGISSIRVDLATGSIYDAKVMPFGSSWITATALDSRFQSSILAIGTTLLRTFESGAWRYAMCDITLAEKSGYGVAPNGPDFSPWTALSLPGAPHTGLTFLIAHIPSRRVVEIALPSFPSGNLIAHIHTYALPRRS
jgi:hypothetical protein